MNILIGDVNLETIYQSTVLEIGEDVEMFLEEKMIIIFNESAPKDLREIAIIHEISPLQGKIEVGDELAFGNQAYKVTFVGDKVNETMEELGHCTIAFNGKDYVDLPGTLCVEEKEMPDVSISTTITFKKPRGNK